MLSGLSQLKNTRMSDIIILDDFLKQSEFEQIRTTMLCNYGFPWGFIDTYLDNREMIECDELNNWQFVHLMYDRGKPCSDYYGLVAPILNHRKLGLVSLVRVKANLNTYTPEKIRSGFHCDVPYECTTAIYYVNTNNGCTVFENGEEVQSLENRLVVFPSTMKHTGTTCTDQKRRVVINFNYFSADVLKKENCYF